MNTVASVNQELQACVRGYVSSGLTLPPDLLRLIDKLDNAIQEMERDSDTDA